MLPNSSRPSPRSQLARKRSVSRSASSDLPPLHAAASPGQGGLGVPPPPPPTLHVPPHHRNEGQLSQASPAFASSQSRKTYQPNRTSSRSSVADSITSLLTSPPIPEIGGQTSEVVTEAQDDENEKKKLLGSPISRSFRKVLRSSIVGSKAHANAVAPTITKAYPSTASSRGRILLLTSLGLNLAFILWASNRQFLEGGATLSSAQSDCQKMDNMQTQQLNSCDLKGRSKQQLCGAGMTRQVWQGSRPTKSGSNAKTSTELVADPTCPRSEEAFDTANQHRISGTKRSMTFSLLYFEEPLFLSHQIASWLDWSKETRGKFNFLIVDDGSRPGLKAADVVNDPELHAKIVASKMDLEIEEIQQDLCWNIAGARNLAVFMAKTDYLYLGDADTLVDDTAAQYMLEIKYNDEVAFRSSQKRPLYYQLDRIRSDGHTKKPHPAVMVISKQTYWTAGGGDEDGMFTSGKFRQRAKWAGIQVVKVNEQMVEKNIPPLQEIDDATQCPKVNARNCQAMEKFKWDNFLPRPEKPDQEQYWDMKYDGQKPWSNEYLRFSWKLAYPS